VKRTLRINIVTAANGYVVDTTGDERDKDNGKAVANNAAEVAEIVKAQLEKSLAGQPAQPQPTKS